MGLVPHSALITRLCILGGVEGDWEEEETCPRTSPLIVTGITKGPKNRGREREAEVPREKEENIQINQIQIDSAAQEQERLQEQFEPNSDPFPRFETSPSGATWKLTTSR